ncbi:threonine-phosphate decarboxylase CobD [Acetobacter orleanensis]
MADAAALQPSVSAPLSAPSPVTLPVLPSNLPLERVPLPSHGGQVRAVMVHFPTAPQPYYDLSTGISPYPYPLRMPEVSVLARLPEEEEEADLQAAAAFAYGLTHPDMVVAGAGSQSLIALLPRLLPAQRVCLLGPTYSGHAQAWYLQGVPVQQVTDPSALEHAAEQPGTVCVVCNPNNPDGRLIASEWMHRLADRCAEHGSFLVVDEAFADFEQESIAPLLPHPALGVLRSFGKTYGLPGVRLGFLLANPERAAQARALLGSWSVGSLALAAGRQALRDTAWLHTARAQARAAHTRLTTLLDAAGLPHTGQVSLFTLVLHQLAPALWQHFCTYGLVTRIFAEQPGRLRVGLPASEAAWARLETALQAWTALHAGGAP